MCSGPAPAGRPQLEVDGHERALRVGRGGSERDPFAADGVLQCLSGVRHDGLLVRVFVVQYVHLLPGGDRTGYD